MTRTHRKRIALIAAAALLFSVLSPAMASVLFSHRPDIMAHVLGVPVPHAEAQPAAEHAEGCEHALSEAAAPMHHGDDHAPSGGTSDHAAHGIFCSFCLAASAGVTVPAAPPPMAAVVAGAAEVVRMRHGPPPPVSAPSTQQARAPPSLF